MWNKGFYLLSIDALEPKCKYSYVYLPPSFGHQLLLPSIKLKHHVDTRRWKSFQLPVWKVRKIRVMLIFPPEILVLLYFRKNWSRSPREKWRFAMLVTDQQTCHRYSWISTIRENLPQICRVFFKPFEFYFKNIYLTLNLRLFNLGFLSNFKWKPPQKLFCRLIFTQFFPIFYLKIRQNYKFGDVVECKQNLTKTTENEGCDTSVTFYPK